LGMLVLPILPKSTWKLSGPGSPTTHILFLLGATVGLPYFLLSTSSPLLQAWYAVAEKDARPYRFFALSNAGSMLALVTYPALIEPFFATRRQGMGWSVAFAGFCALCATLAFAPKSQAARHDRADGPPRPPWTDQALWVALTACASTLLLAITNHLSQNVAPIPFLWILPLSLYLLSFILCFSGKGWYRRNLFLRFLAVAVGGMAYAVSSQFSNLPLSVLIPLYSAGLFICCMVCHGELARLKPAPEYLTSFYLMCAVGGAAGGIFAGLLAPHLFRSYLELPIGLGACAVLVLVVLRHDASSMFYKVRWNPAWLVLVLLTVVVIGALVVETRKNAEDARVMVRNFYGCLKVVEYDSDTEDAERTLVNGTIEHGEQFLSAKRRRQPTAYYGPQSGVGLALRWAGHQGGLRVGVIGLGVGTLAAYGRSGDHYAFYEINPLGIELANSEFSFLRDSAAQVEIMPGDARLSLERQPVQGFDVLVVDAFAGDSIPVHLLTREAFILYFHHLKPGGVLAVHVSNRYLNLKPVVARVTQSFAKQAIAIDSAKDEKNAILVASWVLVSDRREFFEQPEIKKAGMPIAVPTGLRLWTDDYSSLLGVLK